jgi:NADH dehydrogenase
MRILVSGGTGFIGGAIVSTLLKDPQFQVSVLSRDPKKADEKQTAKKTSTSNGSKVSYIKGDVTDPKSLPNFSDFDFVIQCVQFPNHPVQNYSKGWTYERYDAQGTINVVSKILESSSAQKPKIIYFSGAGTAEGKQEPWFQAKWKAEEFIRKSGLKYFILRPSWIYGRGDRSMSRFIDMAKYLPMMPVIGEGKNRVSPLYIQDVVDAVMKCLKNPSLENQTYELGGPEILTMVEIQKTVLEVLGKKKPLFHQPMGLMKVVSGVMSAVLPKPPLSPEALDFVTMDTPTDGQKAAQKLGIRLTPLKEGLKAILT